MVALRLRSRQWIVDETDRIIMGEGRMEILETIEKTGSINQTAKTMKMSYKGVWGRIKATEAYLNKKIVHADRKNGTTLTVEGKTLLEKYRSLKACCLKADNSCFDQLFGKTDE
ncbi:MAG: LysR family transcriptional regulator [Desulfatiglandaceae bacterium]